MKIAILTVTLTAAAGLAHAQVQTFEAFGLNQSVNGQGGWTVEDSFGNSSQLFDESVVDDGTGNRVWRISNAFTSGSLSNQSYSQSSAQIAGESTAKLFNDYGTDHTMPNNPPLSSGTATSNFFYGSWDFKSATGAAQTDLRLDISAAARQSTTRMSFLSIRDSGSGYDLVFFDTTAAAFNGSTIATGLSYSDWHNIEMSIEFVDGIGAGGVGNDILTISLDGSVIHTGTTWESYYAAVADGNVPITEQRAVDALNYHVRGTAATGTLGNGFFIDNVEVSNIPAPSAMALLGLGGLAAARRRRA